MEEHTPPELWFVDGVEGPRGMEGPGNPGTPARTLALGGRKPN